MTGHARYPSLAGRPVFITGGASGIGASLVSAFVRQGAVVCFVDIDETAGQRLAAGLRAESDMHRLTFVACDICDITALTRAIHDFEDDAGPIGVLVNNAANDDRHRWQDVTCDYWDERMAINLRPQFFAIQAAAPGMQRAGGGSIINFGSISWQVALGGMPGYTTAKAAVHGLTRSMARDLGAWRIRVNTVVPGAVLTPRQLDKWITEDDLARLSCLQCLSDHLSPDDVAPTVLFLGADDSRMCTGHEYFVDAGWG